MALNKLKKWIGTQAMTAFFDQLNDNVDATNAAIDAVASHLAEYEILKTNLGATNVLWIGNMDSGSVTLSDNPFNYTHILIEISDSTGGSAYRGRTLVAPLGSVFYVPIMYGATQGHLRMGLSDTSFTLSAKSPAEAKITQIIGICKVK